METCCDFCAQKLTSKESPKFKCSLCNNEHLVPETKLFPLNKFAIDILNIKTFNRLNHSNVLKELEQKLEKITNQHNYSLEDIEDKIGKSKLKINNYFQIFIANLKEKHLKYLNEMNSESLTINSKFIEQKSAVISELSSLKSSSKLKEVSLKTDKTIRDLDSKLSSLEHLLDKENGHVKQLINLKTDQITFYKYLKEETDISIDRINLEFEDDSLVLKRSIYAIDHNNIFYCLKDKKNKRVISRMKAIDTNRILDEFELDQYSRIKYMVTDQNSFYAYYKSTNECFLVKFDSKFNKPKAMNSKRDLLYMNRDEILLFSNKLDNNMIKVLDQDLNSLHSFGQCINESMPYYFKNKSFNIVGASKEKLIVKFHEENNLKVYSRINGNICNVLQLNDADFDESDFKKVEIKFINSSEFKIVIISKVKMLIKVLNDSGRVLKESNLVLRGDFDRFSITDNNLLAFYYETDNSIEFLKL